MVDIPEERKATKTHRIEKSIDCKVPVSTAYNQWTQFESFPQFMEGVESVQQRDDTRLHWVANIAGKRLEWDAKIVSQEPDTLISWATESGRVNNGAVHFEPLGPDSCRIKLVMTYEPEGFVEKVGDAMGILNLRVEGDLRRFRDFIEKRHAETGAWRGEIRGGQVERPSRGQGRESRESHRMPGTGPRTPLP